MSQISSQYTPTAKFLGPVSHNFALADGSIMGFADDAVLHFEIGAEEPRCCFCGAGSEILPLVITSGPLNDHYHDDCLNAEWDWADTKAEEAAARAVTNLLAHFQSNDWAVFATKRTELDGVQVTDPGTLEQALSLRRLLASSMLDIHVERI